jgi:hypothetical protein
MTSSLAVRKFAELQHWPGPGRADVVSRLGPFCIHKLTPVVDAPMIQTNLFALNSSSFSSSIRDSSALRSIRTTGLHATAS